MSFFRVGVIVKAHGVKGAVKVFPTTDDVRRFTLLKTVRFGRTDRDEDIEKTLEIEKVQFFKNQVILKFRSIDTMDEAELLRGGSLWIPDEEALPLEENEFYMRDFLDARVVLEDGSEYGTLYDILETGSNDVFVIRTKDQTEVLLPVIKDCIVKMDSDSKTVTIRLIKGLTE